MTRLLPPSAPGAAVGASGRVGASPVLERRPDLGLVGGVAAGIAAHVGLAPRTVRLLFALLSLAGGLGLALYGAYWIVVPAAPGVRHRLPEALEAVLAVVLAAVSLGTLATSLPSGALAVPTVLGCLGGALIWRQASDAQRDRLRTLSRDSLRAAVSARAGRVRLAVGVALVVAGGVLVLSHSSWAALRDALPAVAVTVAGLALVTGPWWVRMAAQLRAERVERIRSQERAELAAQVHDSVLQTLALIQRNAGSPKEVTRLARGQERDLRALLWGPDGRAAGARPGAASLAEAIRAAAAEVEDAYAVPVETVLVGDIARPDPSELESGRDAGRRARAEALDALVAAAREAMANAARHSGADSVAVYAEVEADAVEVFVRDRGTGFDPAAVDGRRQGLRRSIVERMQRHGGSADVATTPGRGTEVALRLPWGTA